MAAGYIYVLVNSSMPGLIKVGKTTRSPLDRAQELSGVSGVATPFIVAYEEQFSDCDAAELFVHTKLAEKGMRLSSSREFFRAPVSDVVKVITSIPSSIRSESAVLSNADSLITPDDEEFQSFQLHGQQESVPWKSTLREALCHYAGLDEYIQDFAEAMRLYQDAARLGSAMAFEMIGKMHQLGEGTRADPAKALQFYKEGAKRGNFFCYIKMVWVFIFNAQPENARKAFCKFISDGEADSWRSYQEVENCLVNDRHIWELYMLLLFRIRVASRFSGFDSVMDPTLRKYKADLMKMGEGFSRSGDTARAQWAKTIVLHLEALN